MSTKQLTPKQFKKLSRAKRAVLIAKDVIDQINAGYYQPGNTYKTDIVKGKDRRLGADASEIIKDESIKIQCVGCARASLFISAVKFKNTLTLEEVIHAGFDYENLSNDDEGTYFLSDEFDPYQQSLIECAYERDSDYGYELSKNLTIAKAEAFEINRQKAVEFSDKALKRWEKWNPNKARPRWNDYILTEICKNIIKNNGTFKP